MIKTIKNYVDRQLFAAPQFVEPVSANLGLVVTIPCLAEPQLLTSLESLLKCDKPAVDVEVIVMINHPEIASDNTKKANADLYEKALKWVEVHSTNELRFLVSSPMSFPKKHAGAGLARKVAMDEAVVRLNSTQVENPIIACFDGDAVCSENYLTEIVNHFHANPKSQGCSINFEHPLEENKEGITQYELHLRYYQAAMAFANHPHAEFTVGSSMAVTRDAYVLQGGMNRRKAGEDFWFMLKLMLAGPVSSITSATVYPSSRVSDRVPFGTGRAMLEMQDRGEEVFYTAPMGSFVRLKTFLEGILKYYEGTYEVDDELTLRFLKEQKWEEIIDEIRGYTTSYQNFEKRFYRWFNSFLVMKYFHFMRDEGVADVPVVNAANDLLKTGWGEDKMDSLGLLQFFRDKKRVNSDEFTLDNN